MRPRFSMANLLLVTVVVAMMAQMFRNHVRFQGLKADHSVRLDELEKEITHHRAVLAQVRQVRQRELELRAARLQLKPYVEQAAMHREPGVANQSQVKVAGTHNEWQSGLAMTHSVSHRRAASRVRHADLKLQRAQAVLQGLEQELED